MTDLTLLGIEAVVAEFTPRPEQFRCFLCGGDVLRSVPVCPSCGGAFTRLMVPGEKGMRFSWEKKQA